MDNSLPWDRVEAVAHPVWQGSRFDINAVQQQSRTYVAASKKFNKVKEESIKAKQRKEESIVPVFLAGVLEERQEIERARKEARAAGVLPEEEEEEHLNKKEKKSLLEELADDLYVDFALFLMEEVGTIELAVDTKK
ncbi:MAG: hypothetical protein D3924_00665 [Candidatus Electrothrix sp. AR4]|nr:hypothetical protein [Candidatus Electrothrix sp. AR4]